MVSPKAFDNVQPLAQLHGLSSQLEVYSDRILIRRTDFLATYLPTMFSDTKAIKLDEVVDVSLNESKYVHSRWLIFALQLTHHKKEAILFARKDYPAAERAKNVIGDLLSKREPLSAAAI